MISFWHVNRVVTFLLNSNAAEGSNMSTANAADSSLKKLDFNEDSIMKSFVNSLSTNVGGGGTLKGLAIELENLNRTIDLALLLIVICVPHAMNSMMQSLHEKFLGSGSVFSRVVAHLLCVAERM